LRDPARFDAWLDRILVNACRMALRHRRTVRVHEIPAPGSWAAATGPETAAPAGDDSSAEAEVVRHAFR
ncbi:hypothetical protein WFJ45_23135, partial [Salmonella enterica subsp. enterica serovar Minnesota]|uniref:hypothetical protein n=1 Tax=Salmonella enterica TaxID=28901 RepID=UPI003D2C9FC3